MCYTLCADFFVRVRNTKNYGSQIIGAWVTNCPRFRVNNLWPQCGVNNSNYWRWAQNLPETSRVTNSKTSRVTNYLCVSLRQKRLLTPFRRTDFLSQNLPETSRVTNYKSSGSVIPIKNSCEICDPNYWYFWPFVTPVCLSDVGKQPFCSTSTRVKTFA